ncbi:MAG: hypothetical protein FJ240_14105 [Nitrospira sp.]|nr:hypothetical protein [Nitrospira sp.]
MKMSLFPQKIATRYICIKKIYAYICTFIIACAFLLVMTSCERYQVGIQSGAGLLSKSLFFNAVYDEEAGEAGNTIRTIQVGNFKSSSGKEIVIFSKYRCFILDAGTRKLKKTIRFTKPMGLSPELLKINDDGSLEIILRGGGFDDVGLVNTYGEFIWKYKREQGTSPRMSAGKFDRDGQVEFYIADSDGLHKLDHSGKQIWKTKDNVGERDIQIYKPGRNKPSVIITRDSHGNIRYWDATGKLLKEVIPEIESYGLEIIYWPDDYHILAIGDYKIIIMNLDGKIVFQYKLKEDICQSFVHLLEIMDIRGVPVRLEPKKRPYLAVITEHRAALKKTTLSIFSPEGQPIYREMLNSSTGINTLENPDGSESLLVGDGANNIWIYALNKKK